MRFVNVLIFFFHSVYNLFDRNNVVVYISERVDWVIKEVCLNLVKQLRERKQLPARLSYSHYFLKHKKIHFGSVNTLAPNGKLIYIHPSNKVILTWFHIEEGDTRLRLIPEMNKMVHIVHTACFSTKKILVDSGFDEKKVIVIPLGIDTKLFVPCTEENKKNIRKKLGISYNKIVIGSFQKDGNGWKEGLDPKLIKGPDIFCDVVEKLAKKYDVHVLLTGPARGYVKKRLNTANIKFTHTFLKHYHDVIPYYQALDLYLITSRVEGGPMALLEAWATGVSIISTKVGMVLDIAVNNKDVYLVDVEDVFAIVSYAERVIESREDRNRLTQNALVTVRSYDWESIAVKYYTELYSRL